MKLKKNILYNEPMKKHTSFKIGGEAEILVKPKDEKEIKKVLSFARDNNKKIRVIGNGTNILVKDKGVKGIILKIANNFNDIEINKDYVYAKAGIPLSKLAKKLSKLGYKNFEYATGIPGTLGGAIHMNAGAYGGEIKDNLIEVKYMNKKGVIKTLKVDNLNLGYRKSIFQDLDNIIILSAKLKLEKGNKKDILRKVRELNRKRKEKQPLKDKSAGSTFKRLENGEVAVAKLIDDLGLKGFNVGDAQVSKKHAGFFINKKNATAKEMIELINNVKQKVYDEYGYEIIPEIKIIGDD